jgi:hypothetical protein
MSFGLTLLGLSWGYLAAGCDARPSPKPESPSSPTVEAPAPPRLAAPQPGSPVPARSAAAAEGAQGGLIQVGEVVPEGAPAALSAVLASPQTFAGQPLVVEGEVRRACSKKGCWMELATALEPSAPGCRVTFKDYGFFVPTDSAGRHARLSGQVVVKTLRKSHVDHLEAEGANFGAKNADGSAYEVQIVATGVELRKS